MKAQDVRDKVNLALRDLPTDAEQPIIQKIDPDAEPILSVMLSGDMPMRDLTEFADKTIKERLQRVSGVGQVTILGGRKRQIRVWLDADKMRAYGVTADDVVNALRARERRSCRAATCSSPASTPSSASRPRARSRRSRSSTRSSFRSGSWRLPTLLGDVARVEDGGEDERTFATLNGKPGISLEVRRQSGQNTLAVAKAVKAEVDAVRPLLPAGVEMVVARDISLFIEDTVNDVGFDILLGIVLVIIITMAFLLDFRATIIVAIAMPTSLIATFFAFYWAGFTLNNLTLMAFSVAVGLLVDDAIVVLESIHRKLEEGVPPDQAASEGTSQVAVAVMAGTWAVVAVFVPIAFMDGVVGRFFYQYGLAIVFSVLVSLLVSLTLTPALVREVLDQAASGAVRAAHRSLPSRRWRTSTGARCIGRSIIAGWCWASGLRRSSSASCWRAVFPSTSRPRRTGRSSWRRSTCRSAPASPTRRPSARASRKRCSPRPNVKTVFVTIGAGTQARINRISFYVGLTGKGERDDEPVRRHAARRAQLMAKAAPEATHIEATDVPWIGGNSSFNTTITYSLQGPSIGRLAREGRQDRRRDEGGHGALHRRALVVRSRQARSSNPRRPRPRGRPWRRDPAARDHRARARRRRRRRHV